MAAFLRGINVGGRSLLAMADLKSALDDAGLADARTYLLSGNVVVTPGSGGPAELSETLERAIEGIAGRPIRVMVRTRDELDRIVAGNPLWDESLKPASLHTVFLEAAPDPDRAAELDPERSPADRFALSGREIYLHYPQGSGRSRLNLEYFEKTLGVAGTARNWNTVTRVRVMLEE
jgi:uncharacterized protein (DUF1697 family)